MKKLLEFLMLVIMLVASSCSDGGKEEVEPTPVPPTPVITIPTTEDITPVIGQEGGEATVSFTASEAWTASVMNSRADSWVSVKPESGGKGDAKITIIATTNDTPDDRNATITLKCGTISKEIVLSQKQKDALTVTVAKYEVASTGGAVNVEVKANIAFEVEVKSDWITEVKHRALTTTNLNFMVASNESGQQRVGEIVIKSGSFSETIKVYQDFSDFITLTQKEFTLSDAGGKVDVEIKSTIDYGMKMVPEVDWVTEEAGRAVSTHTHHYLVAPNESYDAREVKIVFFDKKNESLADTVSIYQAYKGALIVARNEYEFDAGGGELKLKLQSNLNFEVSSSVDWIRQRTSRGLTDYELRFLIDAHASKESREGEITIQTEDGKNVQVVKVKQLGEVDYEALERVALIALYKAMGGENWNINTNWCSDKPLDTWYGVSVENGRVVALDLSWNKCQGNVPSEIGELVRLKSLFLQYNNLLSLPPEMANLTQLEMLNFSDNKLSDCPPVLGKLVGLNSLALDRSGISSLPLDLENLVQLEYLSLCDNNFLVFPSVIEKMVNLKGLHLRGNQLSDLPSGIGKLTCMSNLNLAENQLSNLPPELKNLRQLTSLALGYNKLKELPQGFENLSQLSWLNLSNNQFTEVPSVIYSMSRLSGLFLDYNQLSGNISSEIGNLIELESLSLNNNKLSGIIPLEIGNLERLNNLQLAENQLTGTLPASFSKLNRLEYIDLRNNQLNGYIPDEVVESRMWQLKIWDLDAILTQQPGYELTYNKDLQNEDYLDDGKLSVLQKHTKGNGIKIVIMGDGFSKQSIDKGKYNEMMNRAMEYFFAKEPYTSFREYFDVYSITAISKDDYIGGDAITALQTDFWEDKVSGNLGAITRYLQNTTELNDLSEEITCIVVLNSQESYRSVCYTSDGLSIAYCMGYDDFGYLVHHEAGGHGFGKLADEYVEFSGWWGGSLVSSHANNRYTNVDTTDDLNKICWKDFINDMRYTNEKIGAYEGANCYSHGVYRPTENSIMRYNTGRYNAPSRLAIYKRIMKLAGEEYSWEKFLEYDAVNRAQIDSEINSRSVSPEVDIRKLTAPPVIFNPLMLNE